MLNTHDITLLSRHSYGYLTRDQVWLTEKNADGATELVTLRERCASDAVTYAEPFV